MAINKQEDKDMNFGHKLFYNDVCQKIAKKNEEIQQYEALKVGVMDLKDNLIDCSLHLKNTHLYTKNGISCQYFDAGIDSILEKAKDVDNYKATVEGIISDIENEIKKRQVEISSLKASIKM